VRTCGGPKKRAAHRIYSDFIDFGNLGTQGLRTCGGPKKQALAFIY
jgi:hypothetical protein